MKIISEIWNKSDILASLTVAVSSAFLLAGYEFVRSASFSLFKAAYGVENLPIVIAISPLGVLTVLWIYGKLLTAFGPRKTLGITTLGSCFSILTCYFLIKLDSKIATAVLFILRDSYAALLIEQFWSLVNSILKESEAKRFNGIILTISTLGGITGGLLVHRFAQDLGTAQLVLIGGLFCIPCWYIAQLGYKMSGYTGADRKKRSSQNSDQTADPLGITLFSENPILFSIAGIILLSQFYAYFVGLNFQTVIQTYSPDLDKQTAFAGLFFAITNATSVCAQFALTPFLLSRFSIASIHLTIPFINFLCLIAMIFFPSVWTAGAAFLIYKTMEYSIFRAAKEILYIPFSFDVRFRAKELIDVFGHRSGQGIASLIFGFFQKLSVLTSAHIPFITTGILASWVLVLLPLRKHTRLVKK